MSAPLFVDTSALYAVYQPADQHHAEGTRFLAEVIAARRTLVSSTDVFDELIALLARRSAPDATVRIGEELRREDVLDFVRIDDETRDRAWAIFRERRLPKLSLTDCTSSAIMTKRQIREVFTFDDDFRRLGHRIVPASRPLLRPRNQARGTRRS